MPLSRDYKNREKEIMSKFSQVRPNKKIIKESEEKDSKEDNDLSKMTIDKLENIINAYQYALGLDPFSYSNWNNISVYLREKEISVSQNTLQRRTFCEAVNSARNAVKYNPKEALCWTTLGEALMTARDSFRAVFCFRKALQIDPNEINAQEYLKKLGKLPKNYVLSKTQRPGKKSPSKILEIFGLHSINEITLEFDYAKFIIELYPEFINDEQLYSSIESVKKDNKFIANVIKDFLLYENTWIYHYEMQDSWIDYHYPRLKHSILFKIIHGGFDYYDFPDSIIDNIILHYDKFIDLLASVTEKNQSEYQSRMVDAWWYVFDINWIFDWRKKLGNFEWKSCIEKWLLFDRNELERNIELFLDEIIEIVEKNCWIEGLILYGEEWFLHAVGEKIINEIPETIMNSLPWKVPYLPIERTFRDAYGIVDLLNIFKNVDDNFNKKLLVSLKNEEQQQTNEILHMVMQWSTGKILLDELNGKIKDETFIGNLHEPLQERRGVVVYANFHRILCITLAPGTKLREQLEREMRHINKLRIELAMKEIKDSHSYGKFLKYLDDPKTFNKLMVDLYYLVSDGTDYKDYSESFSEFKDCFRKYIENHRDEIVQESENEEKVLKK